MAFRRRNFRRRSTPPGEHRPVLLSEVLDVLRPAPGMTAVDCTVGFGGHSAALLRRIGPDGLLLGFDLDGEHFPKVRERLEAVSREGGGRFELHQLNFAGIDRIVLAHGGADMILADLGMSSMQVDDPERGFSYVRDGALDMRMDRSRGKPVSQLLSEIGEEELAQALSQLGDEPEASAIAKAIVQARTHRPIGRTTELAELIKATLDKGSWKLRPAPGKWAPHPAARTFQALRILVNRELANLSQLLRVLPGCLKPGGRAAVISFHSGEDRLVKKAFREGQRAGTYATLASEAVRPAFSEKEANPRARSAKLRWAEKRGAPF